MSGCVHIEQTWWNQFPSSSAHRLQVAACRSLLVTSLVLPGCMQLGVADRGGLPKMEAGFTVDTMHGVLTLTSYTALPPM
eukprot:2866531-Pyramimonas_sp.AAC.2